MKFDYDLYSKIEKSGEPFMFMDITFPYEEMLAEAKALDDEYFGFSRSPCEANAGWSAIAIHGTKPHHIAAWKKYYNDREEWVKDIEWQDVAERCPVTKDFIDNHFPGGPHRVIRFMRIEPGGYINWHVDKPTGQHSLSANSFVLSHPEGCIFETDYDGKVYSLPIEPGKVFTLNPAHDHRVYNNSNETRYHMILHHTKGEISEDVVKYYYESFKKWLPHSKTFALGSTGPKQAKTTFPIRYYGDSASEIIDRAKADGFYVCLVSENSFEGQSYDDVCETLLEMVG